MFMSFLSFMVWGQKSRKPAIDWQSRVSEKSFVRLEFQSHDAQKTGAALPNGHAAIDGRVLQHLRCKRGFHLLPAIGDIISGHLSKFFRRVKKCVVGWRLGARLLQA
jgi:hypothetical protein